MIAAAASLLGFLGSRRGQALLFAAIVLGVFGGGWLALQHQARTRAAEREHAARALAAAQAESVIAGDRAEALARQVRVVERVVRVEKVIQRRAAQTELEITNAPDLGSLVAGYRDAYGGLWHDTSSADTGDPAADASAREPSAAV